jgi:hypothetical protein
VLVVVLTPFFVPIPRSLQRDPLIGAVGDKVHIPLFFVITLLLYRRGRLVGRTWSAAIAALAVGGAVEFLQLLVARSARWDDFQLDIIGVGFAVCWIEWRRRHRTWPVLGAVALTAVIAVQFAHIPGFVQARHDVHERFPLLDDFSHPHALKLWRIKNDTEADLPDLGPPHGKVLRVRVTPPSPYPGVTLHHFPVDWSSSSRLVFRARSVAPDTAGVRLFVRLDDYRSRRDPAWYSTSFALAPEWREFGVDLAELRDPANIRGDRALDVDDMYSVLFFIVRPQEAVTFEIDDIRLVRDAGAAAGGDAQGGDDGPPRRATERP